MALKNTYQARKRFTKTPVKSTGMWYQEEDVVVPSNQITMKGPQGQPDYFKKPILGIGMQSGQQQVMQPGEEYLFPNDQSVFERKMQNGAINLTKEIGALKPKEDTFGEVLNYADLATDVMQAGHFIPHPVGQAVGYVGDFAGAGIDALQSIRNISQGNYTDAAVNAGLALLPWGAGKQGYKRANSLISGKGSGYYRPLQALPHLRNNPVIKKGIGWNRATLGANALEVGSNINLNNNQNNDFGGYQDNTRLAPSVKPEQLWYTPQMWDNSVDRGRKNNQMQNGGLLPTPSVGVDSEMMFRDKYNTQLNSKEQKQFDSWVAKESKRRGRDILMDRGAYDVTGFWKSGDYKRMDSDNHGSDNWKKPNHPTFSNQSKYHGADGWYGGYWTDKAGYQPSKQTLEAYGPDYYNEMFQSEPGRSEYLDLSRYESGQNKPTPFIYQNGGERSTSQNPTKISSVNVKGKMPKVNWYESINPRNWGLRDYSAVDDYSTAYNRAKSSGQDEFYWKDKRYNTKYAGSINEEIATYGVNGQNVNPDDYITVYKYPYLDEVYSPSHIAADQSGQILNYIGNEKHWNFGKYLSDNNISINTVWDIPTVDYGPRGNHGYFTTTSMPEESKSVKEYRVYGADPLTFFKKSRELNSKSDWNLLTNNCADNMCDAFGVPRDKSITTPNSALERISKKYPTLEVTGRSPQSVYRYGGSLDQYQEGGYTIAPGDTFFGIANKFGVTRKEMTGSNPDVNFEKIKAGQRLRVPETFDTAQGYPTGYFETMTPATFDAMGKPIPQVAPKPKVTPQPTSNVELGPDIFLRQAFAESTFNPNAKSPAGYMGLAQIGNDVIADYRKATGAAKVDPYNPADNAKVQQWAMNQIYNSEFVNKENQDPSVRLAKTLASYNWGKGNVRNYLTKQKKKGVDIYNSMDWVEGLPKETRDYIHKIQVGDMNDFEKQFNQAKSNKKYSPYINLYKKKNGGLQTSYNKRNKFKK